MSLTVRWPSWLGALVLGSVWLWPLPYSSLPPFTQHMVMHMAVVGVAAPLLALGLAGTSVDPVCRWPRLCSAVVASMLELVVVWAWHTPELHHIARMEPAVRAIEQGLFLAVGFYLWVSAVGGTRVQRQERSIAGIIGLLLTSMHMTLLGALIALTPRVLYLHSHEVLGVSPIVDQQLGGVVMLFVGAAAYLAGGIALAASLVSSRLAQSEKP